MILLLFLNRGESALSLDEESVCIGLKSNNSYPKSSLVNLILAGVFVTKFALNKVNLIS